MPNNWTLDASPPLTLVLAAPADRANGWYHAFVTDGRFQVLALATDPGQLGERLALQPDALLVDAGLFSGPDALAAALTDYPGFAVAILPVGIGQSHIEAVRAISGVRETLVGDAPFPLLAARLTEHAAARRRAVGLTFPERNGAGPAIIGHRRIAVWSLQGGVGKSTLAAALAMESAARRLPTLLVGLGAPDPLPLSLGLRPDPTLAAWRTDPSPEGLRSSVQRLDGLDVLAGFFDPVALQTFAPSAEDPRSGLPGLADSAAQAGYAVVVFDVSSPELAAAALRAANTLLLVGTPTLPGALHAVEAVRLLNDLLAGRHRIPSDAVHLVLNRVRPVSLTPEEILRAGKAQRRDFPPLAAVLDDDPAIEEALNRKRPAYLHSEPLRRTVRSLGALLFGQTANVVPSVPTGKVYSLGPIRVRV